MITDRFKIGGTYISCTNLADAKMRIAQAVKDGVKDFKKLSLALLFCLDISKKEILLLNSIL